MAVGDGHGAQFRALHLKAGEEILAEETGSLEAEGKALEGRRERLRERRVVDSVTRRAARAAAAASAKNV